jgi:hypothetical protein
MKGLYRDRLVGNNGQKEGCYLFGASMVPDNDKMRCALLDPHAMNYGTMQRDTWYPAAEN